MTSSNHNQTILLLLTLTILLFGCIQTIPDNPPEPPIVEPPPQVFLSISVSNQTLQNDSVLISSLFLDQPGFVVIHRVAEGGGAGSVIGNSALLNMGETPNVTVPVTGITDTTELIAMLHYDNGDGAYTTIDEGTPATTDGTVVQEQFTATVTPTSPTLTVTTQPIENNSITVDSLYLDRPGFAAIHLVAEGGVPSSRIVGNSEIISGRVTNTVIPLSGHEGSTHLIAMLHYDNGDGVYTIADENAPALVDGEALWKRFRIAQIKKIQLDDFAFVPSRISIGAEDRITFENKDPAAHTVTIDAMGINEQVPAGGSTTVEFPDNGTFDVRCTVHPSMTMTVTVGS